MIISIWIILALILALGFLFYFKKKKELIQKPEKPKEKPDNIYSLSDINKMLDNITVKETSEEEIKENESQNMEENIVKEQIKKPFDDKKRIIDSIILKRRKK